MDPLFVEDLDTLKANLRLSGADTTTDSDFDTLLQRAVRSVRVFFRKHLSQARIEKIQAVLQASPVDPDEDDEYLRELAELTEINQTWIELSYLMPVLFMDASAGSGEVYEEEGGFRRTAQEELEQMRQHYKNQNISNLDILRGDETFNDTPNIRAWTFGGSTRNRRVGKSWRKK